VRLTPAWHTAVSPDGTPHTPAGLVINLGGRTVYHLGDTGLFSDLALPGKRDKLDAALVPIGGHYTMDRHDAVEAVKLVGAPTVIPCHYDTFPPIETDAEAFKSDVEGATDSKVTVLQPGDDLDL
jgi:L-ascorbate metabolism protein UlaG (beta-lactamase superfamily)